MRKKIVSKKSRDYYKFILYTFLIFIVLGNFFPFFSMLLNSFRDSFDIVAKPIGFEKFILSNYINAEKSASLIRATINGILISVMSIGVIIVTSTALSYSLAKINFPVLNKVIYGYVALGYLIPVASILINSFILLKYIGLTNTWLGLILVYTSTYTSISTMTISSYMKSIPIEISESAKIDGASHIVICMKIIVPLAKPIIATMMILLFLWTSREYIWPAIILRSTIQKRPIAIALQSFVGERYSDYGQMSAAVVIAVTPILIIFVILKDKIMSGMAAGAVKG